MKKDFNKKAGGNKFGKDGDKPRFGNDRKPYKKDGSDRPKRREDGDDRPKRSFDNDRPKRTFGDVKPERSFGKRDDRDDKPKRKFDGDKPRRNFGENKPERSFDKRDDRDDRPKRKFDGDKPRRNFGENKPERPFGKRDDRDDRPKRKFDSDKPKREYGDKPKRAFDKRDDGEERPKRKFDADKTNRSYGDKPKRSFNNTGDNEDRPKRKFDKDKPKKGSFAEHMNRAFNNIEDTPKKDEDKVKKEPRQREEEEEKPKHIKRARQTSFDKTVGKIRTQRGTDMDALVEKKIKDFDKPQKRKRKEEDEDDAAEAAELMPLNKYISHSGECSRREAAELVKLGKVKVNGELVTDPGHKVTREDKVTVAGKKMTLQTDHVYILMNKPKGVLTTTDDPEGRRTVMDLVDGEGVDRIFPVGRLDRNTTGLLLLTNDGALAQKLSHPSFSIKKVYQATLDKPLAKADFEKIAAGLELEDGPAPVDAIAYLDNKNEIGLEIHIGRNRIVRRIFEHLGYQVEKLDRMMYAGLTKKNLPRGKWRFLEPKEVILLKHFKV